MIRIMRWAFCALILLPLAGHAKLVLVETTQAAGTIPEEMQVGSLNLSQDGRRWACIVQQEHQCCIVIDGQAGPWYDTVGDNPNPSFSPDGKRLAYRAKKGQQWCLVVYPEYGS